MVDARAGEAPDALRVELAPPGSGRDEHGPREHVLTVVEVDPREPLGAVRQLDRTVEARDHRVEALRLKRRETGQVGAGDPGRKAEVVLDARAGPRLPSRRPLLDDQRAQALRAAVDGGGKAGGPATEDHQVEALPVDLRAQTELARDLCGRGVAQDLGVADQDRGLRRRDVERLQRLHGLRLRVDVGPDRHQVALQQVADLESPSRLTRSDQPQDAVALLLVPHAPRGHRLEDHLRERWPAGEHPLELGPLEDQGIGRLERDAARHARLARERGQFAEKGGLVGLGDHPVALGTAVYELDPAGLEHEERHVANALVVDDVAVLVVASFADFSEARELRLRKARVNALVGEVGKRSPIERECRR